MLQLLNIICECDISAGQELVLKPPKEVFSAPVGSSMVISCFISDVDGEASNSYELHWIDHNNLEVTTKTGRLASSEHRITLLYTDSKLLLRSDRVVLVTFSLFCP